IAAFNAFNAAMRKGIDVAVGDFNGDGVRDIAVGVGLGFVPETRVYDVSRLLTGGRPALLADVFVTRTPYLNGIVADMSPLFGGDPGSVELVEVVTNYKRYRATSLAVLPPNRVPAMPPIADVTIAAGAHQTTVTLTASDADNQSLSFSAQVQGAEYV